MLINIIIYWTFVVQLLSGVHFFVTPWTAAGQAALSFTISELAQTHVHWVGDAIQPSHPVAPFSCPQSFPASGSFPMHWLFTSGGQSIGASASVFPMNIQGWFPLDSLVWFPFCPRDSQESSLEPQFESICSLMLNLLYGSTLISIHDYWKNHSSD